MPLPRGSIFYLIENWRTHFMVIFWVGNLPIDKGTLLDTIKNQYTTFHSELQAFLSDLEICDKTNNSCVEA